MEEPVNLAGQQGRQHVGSLNAQEAPLYGTEVELLFGPQIAAEESQVHRRQRRDGNPKRLLQDFIDDLGPQLSAEHQAGMARVGAADDGERGRPASFDQAGIESWYLRRAAHIEVQPPAPELLDALDGLPGLELGFDYIETMLF